MAQLSASNRTVESYREARRSWGWAADAAAGVHQAVAGQSPLGYERAVLGTAACRRSRARHAVS
jgi:hypothetical protein